MITAERSNTRYTATGMEAKLAMEGLSTDVKPIGSFEGCRMLNGSSFFEMDTFAVSMWDEAGQRWVAPND